MTGKDYSTAMLLGLANSTFAVMVDEAIQDKTTFEIEHNFS